jgi:CheY-like chemotaxis protein
MQILLAEDQPFAAEAISIMLRLAGHRVDVVEDGAAALERVQGRLDHYDVVLTDSSMPRLTGVELVKRLRALQFPGRIVVVSGFLRAEDEAAYRVMGVDGILLKPFENDELMQAIGAGGGSGDGGPGG